MAKIELFSADYCPYCKRAKELLERKGAEFDYIDITNDQDMRIKVMERAGGQKTVPQIFIDDQHIGGFDDLSALDREGKLDALLAA